MHRAKALERILDVYRMLEEVREAEAAIAAGEMHEAERSIGHQHEEGRQARAEERQAIREGNDLGWAISSARQQTALLKRHKLERLLVERRQLSAVAQQRHFDSLQWRERIQSLVDGARAVLDMEIERKEQSAADERHLVARRSRRAAISAARND